MIVSAYQPYFAPFPGFFQKAVLSDALVLLDAVQFPRGTTWMTRNRFKNDQGTLWMTIPVRKKGLGLQKINEVNIYHDDRWARKHLASLRAAYSNAPYFEKHSFFLERVFSSETERLIDFNLTLIRHIMDTLGAQTKVLLQSQLGIYDKEPLLTIEICRKLDANGFLAQNTAKKYLDREIFREAGVEIRFFNPRPPVYPQLWGPFIPNLSTFDLLFNCGGPESLSILERGKQREKTR